MSGTALLNSASDRARLPEPPRWAVFISGRGSNAEALWETQPQLDVHLCVSSRAKAYGLLRAKRNGIPTLLLNAKPDWSDLTGQLRKRKINRIFLLGFMKILPAAFVGEWKGRMWNLHPSLLPQFPGAHAIEESYKAGAALGISIHRVTEEMDAGPLCFQSLVLEKAPDQLHVSSLEEVQLSISIREQHLVREAVMRVQNFN